MLTALLLAIAAPASVAAAPSATPQAEAPVPSNALELARLLNPEKETIAVGLRAFDLGLSREFDADPEHAAFEKDHPGFTKLVTATARTVFTDHLRAGLGKDHLRYARFFGNRFDPAEIDALIAFYGSPTGTKVVAGMYSLIDLDHAMDQFDSARDGEISGTDIATISTKTGRTLASAFDDADKAALAKLSTTPAYAKLMLAMPAYQQLMAEISNEPDPELDAKLEAAIATAVETFLAEEEAKASTS